MTNKKLYKIKVLKFNKSENELETWFANASSIDEARAIARRKFGTRGSITVTLIQKTIFK